MEGDSVDLVLKGWDGAEPELVMTSLSCVGRGGRRVVETKGERETWQEALVEEWRVV